jgi:hypothetical protein
MPCAGVVGGARAPLRRREAGTSARRLDGSYCVRPSGRRPERRDLRARKRGRLSFSTLALRIVAVSRAVPRRATLRALARRGEHARAKRRRRSARVAPWRSARRWHAPAQLVVQAPIVALPGEPEEREAPQRCDPHPAEHPRHWSAAMPSRRARRRRGRKDRAAAKPRLGGNRRARASPVLRRCPRRRTRRRSSGSSPLARRHTVRSRTCPA